MRENGLNVSIKNKGTRMDPETVTESAVSQTEKNKHGISSVQPLSFVSDSETAWTAAGFPVHHQLLELAQSHGHRVGDASRLSSLLLLPSSFPASASSPLSQVFASCSQRTGTSV